MDIAAGGFGTKRSEGKLSLQRFCKLRYFGKIRAARRDGISKAALLKYCVIETPFRKMRYPMELLYQKKKKPQHFVFGNSVQRSIVVFV